MPKECYAVEPCEVKTPWGTAQGMKCPLGPKLNRRVTMDGFRKFVKQKQLTARPGGHEFLSLSTCPRQTYGGTIRFVIDTEKVKQSIKPMCYMLEGKYAEGTPNEAIVREIDQEGRTLLNTKGGPDDPYDYVRAKWGLSPEGYSNECEYESFEPIPLPAIKSIEYWIARYPDSVSVTCQGNAGQDIGHSRYFEEIEEVKARANDLGIPFHVKSCFPTLLTDKGWKEAKWGNPEVIPLVEENFRRMAKGDIPVKKMPLDNLDAALQKCKC